MEHNRRFPCRVFFRYLKYKTDQVYDLKWKMKCVPGVTILTFGTLAGESTEIRYARCSVSARVQDAIINLGLAKLSSVTWIKQARRFIKYAIPKLPWTIPRTKGVSWRPTWAAALSSHLPPMPSSTSVLQLEAITAMKNNGSKIIHFAKIFIAKTDFSSALALSFISKHEPDLQKLRLYASPCS